MTHLRYCSIRKLYHCAYGHHKTLCHKTLSHLHMMTLRNGNISAALLARCEGNPSVTSGFCPQRPVTRSFEVFFDLRRRNSWVSNPNNRDTGDLIRHRGQCNEAYQWPKIHIFCSKSISLLKLWICFRWHRLEFLVLTLGPLRSIQPRKTICRQSYNQAIEFHDMVLWS